VKLDVKAYPIFNGEPGNWTKFKRGVLALAATHGLDKIFDSKTVVPDPFDTSYMMYQEKNKFVYSIWISRVSGGLALTTLREFEDDKDGRGACLKFLQIYEGKHNMGQVAIIALAKSNSLYLAYNTPGGAPVFISKFRDALQDLKDAKEPISDLMAKSMFLSKIQDNNFRAIVDILISSHHDGFEESVTRILDKYNMMSHSRGNNDYQSNRTQERQNNNTKSNYGQKNTFIQQEEWDNMTYEEKKAVLTRGIRLKTAKMTMTKRAQATKKGKMDKATAETSITWR
jgi:hypothetical protein